MLGKLLHRLLDFVIRHWKVVLTIAVIVLSIAGYAGYRAFDYIENDPKFCTTCHLMNDPHERWSKSAHKTVSCHVCHPGNMINNLRQVYLVLTNGRQKVESHAEVPATICKGCHMSNDERWKQVANTAGHKIHAIKKDIECVVCHAPGVHQFLPNDEMCRKCHAGIQIAFGKMKENHCTTCHKFLATDRDDLMPRIEDCAKCHTRQIGAAPAIDAGWHPDVACRSCHPVHDRPAAEGEEPVERDGLAVNCSTCHEQILPVSHDSCRNCHPPHTQFSPKAQCGGCHKDRLQAILPPWKHQCGDCHRPHQPGLTMMDTCIDCHSDKVHDLERSAQVGHDACDRCHVPHEQADAKPMSCADCHPKQWSSKHNHKNCQECHDPHRPKDPPDCKKCHENKLSALHEGKHTECVGCHKPHEPKETAKTVCISCHTGSKAKPILNGHDKCYECHTQHADKPIRPIDNCVKCHQKEVTKVALEPEKHRLCNDCHPPHQPQATRTKRCPDCHQDKKQSLLDQPKGHQECMNCHPVHAVKGSMSCNTCHAKQVAAVSVSKSPKHKDCVGCHGGVHKPDPPAPATNVLCLTCHKEVKEKGLHLLKKHQDCLNCHGNHGPKWPSADTCTKCHPLEKIPTHPAMPPGETKCYGCHNFLGAK